MIRQTTTICHNCERPIESKFYQQHLRNCETTPQQQQQQQQKQTQRQHITPQVSRIQKQQSSDKKTENPNLNLKKTNSQQNEMQYLKCEYCDERYPDIMFQEHVELCDARKQLLKFQEEEQQPRQKSSQIHHSHSHNNNNRNVRNRVDNDEDINQLQPGQGLRSETLLPNGQVQIIMAQRDQQGNLQVMRQIQGNGCESRNETMQLGPGRGIQIQTTRPSQIRSSSHNNVQVVHGIGSRNSDRQSMSPVMQYLGQIIQHLLRGDQQEQQGLQEADMQALNSVKYKKSNMLSEENKKCVICMTDYEQNDDLKLLRCTHRFHNQCIVQWLKDHSNCPICKKSVME